jgi:hypothetical protein
LLISFSSWQRCVLSPPNALLKLLLLLEFPHTHIISRFGFFHVWFVKVYTLLIRPPCTYLCTDWKMLTIDHSRKQYHPFIILISKAPVVDERYNSFASSSTTAAMQHETVTV